ncbi:unnamed protein product [Sphenostylis stenocarpa]|uniref:Uncharacterized protein n=1 Tax=Sphenostylis stenocarpa TaxID=92480 RepID=A0AA86T2T2_9FABA|nr:unnamed protein product [Sphenostylis stenocarpa]
MTKMQQPHDLESSFTVSFVHNANHHITREDDLDGMYIHRILYLCTLVSTDDMYTLRKHLSFSFSAKQITVVPLGTLLP